MSHRPRPSALRNTSHGSSPLHRSDSRTQLPPSPQDQHVSMAHRIRHIFDAQKHAVFVASVTIHELGNVPQLEGEFAVRWKFRGRRPKGKEAEPHPKPSLPNLKLSAVHPSTSTLSLRSTATSTSPTSPVRSLRHPSSLLRRPSKSAPIPPQAVDVPASEPTPPLPRILDKKLSDPTPLRQSTGPGISSPPVESPKIVEEPMSIGELPKEVEPEGRGERDVNGSRRGSDGSVTHPTAGMGNADGSLLPSESVNDSSKIDPSVPFPKLSRHPSSIPARSGTNMSPSTLLDSLPAKSEYNDPASLSRQASETTTLTRMTPSSSSSSLSTLNPFHSLQRHRSTSGPAQSTILPTHNGAGPSTSRKGVTPGRQLKQHTCTWDYDIQHALRVPLGKAVAPSSSGLLTPNKPRHPAPLLGEGPTSDSGIRLIIEQLPTPAATTTHSALAADKDSASSMLTAVQKADHGKGNPSEAGRGKGSDVEKTVFGAVDVDLAAFAGRGKTTRRFLLKGSKTNATIKLTVEMRWIGGEEDWAAPPMQEGHHVTGIRDLVGSETQDAIRSDLHLGNISSSNSSSDSNPSNPVDSSHSLYSSKRPSRNHSAVSLVGPSPATDLGYKSYEHHLLRPEDASKGQGRSPDRDTSTRSPLHLHRSHHHHHHSRHMRGVHSSTTNHTGIHELPPEVVVEAIFNPHPAAEEGPFTYVPGDRWKGSEREQPVVANAHDPVGPDEKLVNGADRDHRRGLGGRIRARMERRQTERLASARRGS